MKFQDNPNYLFQERPYKPKFVCCRCRKVFKRTATIDLNILAKGEQKVMCPDCGNETQWVGPKFRAPKSTDVARWKSVDVLLRVNVFRFIGWASEPVLIPSSKKSLVEFLISIKANLQLNIDSWSRREYTAENSQQIRVLSEILKKINTELELINQKN